MSSDPRHLYFYFLPAAGRKCHTTHVFGVRISHHFISLQIKDRCFDDKQSSELALSIEFRRMKKTRSSFQVALIKKYFGNVLWRNERRETVLRLYIRNDEEKTMAGIEPSIFGFLVRRVNNDTTRTTTHNITNALLTSD